MRIVFASLAMGSALAAQTREKRIVPVSGDLRENFERQPKIAVLAGVGVYPSRSGLSRLRFPAHDVELLEAELSKQGYKVVALKEQEATRGSVEQALKDAAELVDRGQGTVLFFFSGHGFSDKGENYLATFEATSGDLAGSGLAVKKVEALLKATGAPRQVMFIDACRNEPGKGVGARSFEGFQASAGLRELLSTKAGRISYEDDQLGSGVFTHFLVKGLEGGAAGQDGLITFRDLADYVTEGVSTFGFQHGQMQVPYEAGESSGDFLLARAGAVTGALSTVTPLELSSGLPPNESPTSAGSPARSDLAGTDVTHFLGLQKGDKLARAVALFGRPFRETTGDARTNAYFGPGDQNETPINVNVDAGTQEIRSVSVFERSPGTPIWARRIAPSDWLLNLIGKSDSDVRKLLGAPDWQPTPNNYLHYRKGGDVLSLQVYGHRCVSVSVLWDEGSR